VQNSDDNHKTILPRMWSTDHIANYNFTNVLVELNPDYPYEEDLAKYGIDASKLPRTTTELLDN
jgi:hypothetical protein